MTRNKNYKSGFTLIELLVVVSIISVLSSVVLSSMNKARASARDSYRIQSLISLRNALNLYASNNDGNFPNGTFYTFISVGVPETWEIYAWGHLKTRFLAPYISTLPTDPLGKGCNEGLPSSLCEAGYSDPYWWMYTNSFQGGSIGAAGAEGTCLGKALILINSMETGKKIQECQFNPPLSDWLPNATIMLLN